MSAFPLDGLTVIDCGGDATALLGRMLSNLGARVGLLQRAVDLDAGLPPDDVGCYRAAFRLGKSPVELEDLSQACGAADIVLASHLSDFPQLGALAAWSSRFPHAILVTITPFGTSGPLADRASSDLVNMAMSGYLNMTGPDGGPPLKPSAPFLSWRHASNHGLAGLLLALRHRRLTGVATHVDVAARDTGLWMLTHTYQYWDMARVNLRRKGSARDVGKPGNHVPSLYQCADGLVVWMLLSGRLAQGSLDKLVNWMRAEGKAPDWLLGVDWLTLDLTAVPDITSFMAPFANFFLTKTKLELLDRAIADGYMIAPVCSVEELLKDPQLAARGIWCEARWDEIGVRLPAAPVVFRSLQWRPNTCDSESDPPNVRLWEASAQGFDRLF